VNVRDKIMGDPFRA